MKSKEIKKKYIEFFKKKGHKEIPSASLVPENDPSVLFTTAGMHPLVPYLLGQKHPLGDKLVNSQKCIRTGDIEEVGNSGHLTFFEMFGNWSLGDYWKEDAIKFSFEFFVDVLGMDKEKLSFTCFKGDKNAGKDKLSYEVYKELGIKEDKIFFLGRKENWWGPVGEEGPCGPCSEIFYDTGKRKCSKDCDPSCSCGKYVEIGNNVFMEFNKKKDKFIELEQKNVDFGGGFERIVMILQKKDNVFETDLFKEIVKKINSTVKIKKEKEIRIIADHVRSLVFILSENVRPSNVEQGYVLRRLIRRVMRLGRLLEGKDDLILDVAKVVIKEYKDFKELKKSFILDYLKDEKEKFENTLERGLRYFEKEIDNQGKVLDKKFVFNLFASYGFPIEMTKDLAKERKKSVNDDDFWKEYRKHQEISRKGASKKFKGGLGDESEEVIKYHTTTHLLLLALREVLGEKVMQRGSNLTKERLRFDFSFERKLTDEEKKEVEDVVNNYIKEKLEVKCEEMDLEKAKKKTKGMFEHKYSDKVKVFSIGKSVEICGGPHVKNTKELGKFRIKKEGSVSAGVRRIKGVLE